jgi:hypothetical protein
MITIMIKSFFFWEWKTDEEKDAAAMNVGIHPGHSTMRDTTT